MLKIAPEQLESVSAPALQEVDDFEDLAKLLQDWTDAKAAELTANERRLEVERKLADLLPAPEEGQKSHRIGQWKVTRENGVRYAADLPTLAATLAELQLDLVLTKPRLDEAAAKRLRKADRYTFDLLVSEGALSAKPAKPLFTVARVATAEQEQAGALPALAD